jgi:hypothetical protein
MDERTAALLDEIEALVAPMNNVRPWSMVNGAGEARTWLRQILDQTVRDAGVATQARAKARENFTEDLHRVAEEHGIDLPDDDKIYLKTDEGLRDEVRHLLGDIFRRERRRIEAARLESTQTPKEP